MPDTTPPYHDVPAEDGGQILDFPRHPEPSRHDPPLELTSFVGREREISELEDLLFDGARLLTLTGPGGSGKTRLALAVATETVGRFEDGVWWVELAPISDPALLPQAVAQVLRVPELPGHDLTEMIIEDLGELEILIVLDNCEHLVEACAVLSRALLQACPNLSILTTSREPLGVTGERNFPIPPLSTPETAVLTTGDLEGFESVRLFVERASYRQPGFALDDRSAASVAEICRRLDGIPLAIELAAARTRVLSVEQISARLVDSFRLLRSESRTMEARQQTLEAAIDWSHELLDEPERTLFRRLSVFVGGFDLEASEAVCAGGGIEEDDVLDLLSRLVDKSLVLVGEQAEKARYRMLETIRQYGHKKLEGSADESRARRLHAQHYLTLAEDAEADLRGPDQVSCFRRLEQENGNFRAALAWTLDGQDEPSEERAELGLRLTVALWLFWNIQGSTEASRWVEEALGRTSRRTAARARALNGAGWISLWGGDYDRAVSLLEEGVSLFEELGDRDEAAISLAYLGMTAVRQADEERIPTLREEADTLRRDPSLGRRALAELLFFLAAASSHEQNYQQAMAYFEESRTEFRGLEDVRGVSRCLISFGMVSVMANDYEATEGVVRQGLESAREIGDKPGTSFALLVAAALAGVRRDPARAARLWGAAEALRETIGLAMGHQDQVDYDYEGRVAVSREQLDEAEWQAAWNEGRTMSPEHAIEYALARGKTSSPATPGPSAFPSGLSPREVDVLKLVAQGLTNARIAQDLFISPNTVNRHLNSIYHKLGVSSRAAATRFATEHNLA